MASLRSLARQLGISPATVSRVLAGRPHVQDGMRARVLAAAVAAGLASPSAGAASGRRLLALVEAAWGRDRRAAPLAELLAGAAQGARQAGAVLHTLAVEGQPDSLDAIPAAQRLRPSALLLCHWYDDASAAALSQRLPSVVVGQPPADPSAVRHATFDAANGVLRLLDHLLGLGHRRIAFLGDAGSGWRGRERLGAALAAAAQRGVAVEVLRVETGQGWDGVRRSLQAGITGWICDAQGTGEAMLAHCADWAVRVPQEASVCSFCFVPPVPGALRLTGMRGDWRAVGRIAARWALTRPDRLDPGTRLLVQSQVEPGDTTGPVSPARDRRRAARRR